MKLDTLAPLVDVHSAFDALAELKDKRGLHGPEARRFLRFKLKECAKSLRDTARHLEEQLKILPEGE